MSAASIAPILASGLEYGFANSTTTGWVICGVLFVLSIFSWTVMISKMRLVLRARRVNAEFLDHFRRSAHPLGLFLQQKHFDLAPLYHIYHAACRELSFYLIGKETPDPTFATRLQGAGRISPTQMGAVQNAMERAVAEAALRLESRMSVVAMALSGAPFLGLLGTVWGVMDSFSGLAGATQGAGLQAMAPGVCAALLTTVVGLLVAIPSMFGYNLLVNKIRALIVRLDNFASEFNGILDRHFVDHHGVTEELPSFGSLGAPSLPGFSGAPSQPMQAPMSAAPSRL